MGCTCGSNAVGSHLHSTWCDTVQGTWKKAYTQVRYEASSSKKAILYVTPSYKPHNYTFQRILATEDQNIYFKVEDNMMSYADFRSGSRVIVISEDRLAVEAIGPIDMAFVEQCDGIADIKSAVHFWMNPGGTTRIVDPDNLEVIDGIS